MYCTKSLITTSQAFTGTTKAAWTEQAAKPGTEGARGKGREEFTGLSQLVKPHWQWPGISAEKLQETRGARENPLGSPLTGAKIKQSQPFCPQHRGQVGQSSKAHFLNRAVPAFPCWSRHERLSTPLPHHCGQHPLTGSWTSAGRRTSASGASPRVHVLEPIRVSPLVKLSQGLSVPLQRTH